MSDKTPGRVLYEQFDHTDYPHQDWNAATDKEHWENCAAAVIAHVRPQIEAGARAAAVEECAQEMDRRSERDRIRANDQTGVVGFGVTASFAACYNDAAKACRAIASAPPGYVCVPVEFVQTMEKIAKYPESRADEWSAESYREMARKALAAARTK